MLPKGILFDLDDTILAYGRMAKPIWKEICNEFSQQNDRLEPVQLYGTVKEVSRWYWNDEKRHRRGRNDLDRARREVLELVFEKLKVDDIPLAHKIADTFEQRREQAYELFDGAVETLDYLRRNNTALALMTNGEESKQRAKINRFDLEKYFKVILVEGEQGFGKPDERVYKMAMEKMGLKPDECWAVGDNLTADIEGPQKLGIYSIWNDHTGRGLPEDTHVVPDRIINSIRELID